MNLPLSAGARAVAATLVALPLSLVAAHSARSEPDLMRPSPDPAFAVASLPDAPDVMTSAPPRPSENAASDLLLQAPGSLIKQTASVSIACFPVRLRTALSRISTHFGRPVIVTSGHRSGGRRGSLHRSCKAADIQIAGVSSVAIARYARSLDGVGGVGTYRHTRSIHVDVGERVFSWHGNRRRVASLQGGCCPDCAGSLGRRFEAVCTG
jgi:hypothetical protein